MPPSLSASFDPSVLDPNLLWAVWFRVPAFLQNAGVPPVQFKWVIASAGEEGLAEIASPKGFPTSLITAAPLSSLQAFTQVVAPVSDDRHPEWVNVAMDVSQFSLVREKKGQMRIVDQNHSLDSGETVLVQGHRNDFLNLLKEGEEILKGQAWGDVYADLRWQVQGDRVNWLHYKKDPEGAALMESFLKDPACSP